MKYTTETVCQRNSSEPARYLQEICIQYFPWSYAPFDFRNFAKMKYTFCFVLCMLVGRELHPITFSSQKQLKNVLDSASKVQEHFYAIPLQQYKNKVQRDTNPKGLPSTPCSSSLHQKISAIHSSKNNELMIIDVPAYWSDLVELSAQYMPAPKNGLFASLPSSPCVKMFFK